MATQTYTKDGKIEIFLNESFEDKVKLDAQAYEQLKESFGISDFSFAPSPTLRKNRSSIIETQLPLIKEEEK